MKFLKTLLVVLAMVAFASNAYSVSTTINVKGDARYTMAQGESRDDGEVFAVYFQKHALAEEAADKLIAQGLTFPKEEIVAVVETSQKYSVGNTVLKGAILVIPVALVVNSEAVNSILTQNSKCWKELTCKWSREAMDWFRKAMTYKGNKNYGGDYSKATKKLRALIHYQQSIYAKGDVSTNLQLKLLRMTPATLFCKRMRVRLSSITVILLKVNGR